MTWSCVYPVVTLLVFAIEMFELALPIWLQTFVLTAIFVPIMVLIIAPKVNRIMTSLITKKTASSSSA